MSTESQGAPLGFFSLGMDMLGGEPPDSGGPAQDLLGDIPLGWGMLGGDAPTGVSSGGGGPADNDRTLVLNGAAALAIRCVYTFGVTVSAAPAVQPSREDPLPATAFLGHFYS